MPTRSIPIPGSSGKVNPPDRCPTLHVALAMAHPRRYRNRSREYLERAYDDAKYGKYSRRPYMNVVIPSDRLTVAPPGKHVMSILFNTPHTISRRARGLARTSRSVWGHGCRHPRRVLSRSQRSILHRQVLTPWDLEQDFGLTEGNIFHGELSSNNYFSLGLHRAGLLQNPNSPSLDVW